MTIARKTQRVVSFGVLFLALAFAVAACNRESILEGERFPVSANLQDSIPTKDNPNPQFDATVINTTKKINLPPPKVYSSWPTRSFNAAHHIGHSLLSSKPVMLWRVSIGRGNNAGNRITTGPIVADGLIFTMDSGTLVSAVNTSGSVVWQVDIKANYDNNTKVSGGGLSYADETLFVTTGYGQLVAIEGRTGQILWSKLLRASVVGAPTATNDGVVYVSTKDGVSYSINAKDGRILWSKIGASADTTITGAGAPVVLQDRVVFPQANGQLISTLRLNGETTWISGVRGGRNGRAYAAITSIAGDPAVVDDVIYAGTAAGRLAAVDMFSGQRLWEVNEGALNTPLVVDDSVFVINDEAQLMRLERASGKRIWAVDLPDYVSKNPKKHHEAYSHYGPLLAGGYLLTVSTDGLLRMFDPVNGAIVYTSEIPGGAAEAPVIADETLYVVSRDGELYAFR